MAEPIQHVPSAANSDAAEDKSSLLGHVSKKVEMYHGRIPYLRRLPFPALAIILLIASINALVWVAVGIVLHFHPALISTAILSYTLGLRHALDADHISAIDLMTRRLIASGQRPVTVGMFFSLGHSTIVVVTSIVVAATASAVSDKFDRFSQVGGIIGTSVSAAFLILLGIMNVYILHRLLKQLSALIATHPSDDGDEDFKIHGAGCLFNVFKSMFKMIDRPWKMYPLGILFGLGFDTSSEIALLGISSIQAARGTSIWLILLFPLLFTAGMCLLDTGDGALMMALYTSTALARDRLAVLYYSIVLTVITVAVALVIGTIQLLTLVLNVAGPTGRFWDGVERAGESYEIIGGSICASFLVFGALSVLLYKPWRRRIDAKRQRNIRRAAALLQNDDGDDAHSPSSSSPPQESSGGNGGDNSPAASGSDVDTAAATAARGGRGGGGVGRTTPYGTVEIDEEAGLDGGGGKGAGQRVAAREVRG